MVRDRFHIQVFTHCSPAVSHGSVGSVPDVPLPQDAPSLSWPFIQASLPVNALGHKLSAPPAVWLYTPPTWCSCYGFEVLCVSCLYSNNALHPYCGIKWSHPCSSSSSSSIISLNLKASKKEKKKRSLFSVLCLLSCPLPTWLAPAPPRLVGGLASGLLQHDNAHVRGRPQQQGPLGFWWLGL